MRNDKYVSVYSIRFRHCEVDTIVCIEKCKKQFFIFLVIAEKLGIKLLARDLRVGDPKGQIKTVLGQWLPIDRTILEMVVKHVPAPNSISDERAQRLLYPENVDLNTYPPESLALTEDFKKCDANSDNIIVFVSKMTPVHITHLPQNKPKRLTDQELQMRRDEVRKRIEERKQLAAQSSEVEGITKGVEQMTTEEKQQQVAEEKQKALEKKEEEEKPEFVFVAFARIFSGTLRKGMKLYSLAPKHDPRNKE